MNVASLLIAHNLNMLVKANIDQMMPRYGANSPGQIIRLNEHWNLGQYWANDSTIPGKQQYHGMQNLHSKIIRVDTMD